MTYKEYLPYHAFTIFNICKRLNKTLYFQDEINISTLPHSATNRKIITHVNEILDAFKQGGKLVSSDFIKEYMMEVFIHGTEEQRKYLLVNNNRLIGGWDLIVINQILPHLPHQSILDIFNYASMTMAIYTYTGIKQVASILSTINHGDDALFNYLTKRNKVMEKEHEWVAVKDALIYYFPDKLEKFNMFPLIQEYIDAKNNPPNIFEDNTVAQTYYLRFNAEIAKNKFHISSYTSGTYRTTIKSLMQALEQSGSTSGVVKIHIKESFVEKEYQYTHIYISVNQDSKLTLEHCKKLINDYYYYSQYIDTNNFSLVEKNMQEWVAKKIFHDQLDTQLAPSQSTKKQHKI